MSLLCPVDFVLCAEPTCQYSATWPYGECWRRTVVLHPADPNLHTVKIDSGVQESPAESMNRLLRWVPSTNGRAWKLVTSFDFINENIAGFCAIIGMLIGSTTIVGSLWQLGASVCWFTMIVRKQCWGIVPFNIALVAVALVNIWRAW